MGYKFLISLLLVGLATSQTGMAQQTRSLEEIIGPTVEAFLEDRIIAGSLQVTRGTEIYERHIGMADEGESRPNHHQTSFMVASNGKQFTATAILKLVEREKLQLETPVTELIPELKTALWTVDGEAATVHHLLTHSAGTPNAYDTEAIEERLFRTELTAADFITAIIDLPLQFKPGSDFAYSNTGYILLGEIIRRVAGVSYSDFLTLDLWPPLGMVFTSVGRPCCNREYALPYLDVAEQGKVNYLDHYDIRYRHDGEYFSDGNVYSSTRDMTKWIQNLVGGEVLDRGLTKKMFRDYGHGYGYGWGMAKLTGQRDYYYHTGGWIGYQSEIVYLPSEDVTIVWLVNYGEKGDLATRVLELF